jgi:hypothetical protein
MFLLTKEVACLETFKKVFAKGFFKNLNFARAKNFFSLKIIPDLNPNI